jgi:hypothetical protein
MNIDIYVIKSDHLKIRFKQLEITLERIKKIFKENNYKTNVYYISSPTIEDIEKNINDYNKLINLNNDDIEDDEFKKLQSKFNFQQLSNLFKHKKVYEIIKNKNSNDNTHNFIIEDDIILFDNNETYFKDFLKKIHKIDYDILFTCCIFNNNKNGIDYLLSTLQNKILQSKSSYFINKKTANELYEYLNVIRFNIKLSISKFVFDNKNKIKSYVLNKPTFLEGSKIGLFPTTVNSNNLLIQNNNFIEFINMFNDEKTEIKKFEEFYEKYGKNNPDYQHILGLKYYKNKQYKEAVEILQSGVINTKNNEGLIEQFSELLNNCINMHQYYQEDIKDCFSKKGKYS